jgi:hypothetical protein
MIKFFRRIRQRLLSENKFNKYLLYAIGEIMLVVIGILFALQINNWNENRKTKSQEIKILNQLNADLNTNLEEIEYLAFVNARRLRMCDSIVEALNIHRSFDDSLQLYFERINSDNLFNCSNTTYKYIQNQGVNFLSNDSLRIKVTRIYEHDFENIFTRENMSWRIMNEDLRPAYDRLFKAGLASNQETNLYLVNTPRDMETLYADEAFKNVIVRLRAILVIRVRWLTKTIIDLKNLTNEIDTETNRLSSMP